MDKNNLKSVSDKLSKYSYCCNDDDYITVTEWANGEGYDININGKLIQLYDGELDAINYLVRVLMYDMESK